MKPEERKKHKKTIVALSSVLIMILGLAVYANSLNGKFVYDDEILIKNNALVKEWPPASKFFTENMGKFAYVKSPFYRPLQMITYCMDYHVWKLNPMGYHLTNIILHVLVALGIYWLITILFEDKLVSFLTAILFITHPIHTTVVSYISTRAESLYLLFTLLSFIFYIKSLKANNLVPWVIMVASYLLALLSKENALILPVLILLYHYAFKKKISPREFISIAGIAFIYILLRITVLKYLITGVESNSTLFQRVPGFFAALATYIRLLFLPLGLHVEYGFRLFNPDDPRTIAGVVILAALLFCVFKTIKANRLISFSILWFLITLLPVSNLYPLNAYMSENWLYLPSIGLFLALAKFLKTLYERKNLRMPVFIFMACLLTFYSYLTFRQNKTWADPIIFYERTLRYAPDSAAVYSNLGEIYAAMGKREKAMALYKKAIKLAPSDSNPYNNLAILYSETDKEEDAVSMYKKSIELNPYQANAYNNLANTYYGMGKKEEAISMYKKAIEIIPGYSADAYNNLGLAYYNMDKKEDAAAMYKKAIELDPDNNECYNNLGLAYYGMGKKEEAISMYKKAIELKPDYPNPYNNLGNAYNGMGRKEEAVSMYKRAIELKPDYANAYNNLGFVYYEMGKKEEAIPLYNKAIELDPGFTAAYTNLGVAYYETGKREDAIAAFKKALELNPDNADARRNLEAISQESQ
ncbi:MAG: tetratricopeptide repeat protein [Candidatus Omnitrophica bacterium]|nr:tetratricopeptide repeat protein [Candidatus Omnitrophota bacterium]